MRFPLKDLSSLLKLAVFTLVVVIPAHVYAFVNDLPEWILWFWSWLFHNDGIQLW